MTASATRRPSTAARTAAQRKSSAVEFRGKSFTIPSRADQVSIEALEAVEAGNVLTATKELLGEKQWQSLRPLLKTAADLNAFYSQLQENMALGES